MDDGLAGFADRLSDFFGHSACVISQGPSQVPDSFSPVAITSTR